MSVPDTEPRMPESRAAQPRDDEPRVTIEMGGPNIVIRSSAAIDREYTASLAHAVDAAADTGTVVVLDPDPIRCDDAFAGAPLPPAEIACDRHASCRPTAVEVVGSGVIRFAAEHCWWTLDVAHGRFCRTDRPIEPCFVSTSAWTNVVAVCVTPTRLRALTEDGSLVTSIRAHEGRVAVTA